MTAATGAAPQPTVVAARTGHAFRLAAGQDVRIVNTHGGQVVDTWAFDAADPGNWLSMEHCREVNHRLLFRPGDALVTRDYTHILEFVADTSPGIHDTLIAACNRQFYRRGGIQPETPNCQDNLAAALAAIGLEVVATPCPWNLFMIARVEPDGDAISYHRPDVVAGATVHLRAAIDCVLVVSACPDTTDPTNGGDGTPQDIEVIIG